MIRRPPRSTLFPTRRSSDLSEGTESRGSSGANRKSKGNRPRARTIPLRFSDRKSTRLNSSHQIISYAVFCLKKKRQRITDKEPPLALSEQALEHRHIMCVNG